MSDLRSLTAAARTFLAGRVRRTPVEASPALAERLGVPVLLKLENLQITGSFKIRGAWFRLAQMSDAQRRAGVMTCSAGNHGKALAYAGRVLGARVIVCLPDSVEPARRAAIAALGAEVRVAPCAGYDDAEDWTIALAARERLPFVSAFDDPAIMAGSGGTIGAEVLEDAPETRCFVTPVGGGGLSAGLAFVVKEQRPDAHVIGVQHELCPALSRSLAAGSAVTRMPAATTLAGGIEGGIGSQTFAVLRSRIDQVALVSEAEILAAVRWLLDEHQYLVEPTGAVALAACLAGKVDRPPGPAVVVVTGRNVSRAVAQQILES